MITLNEKQFKKVTKIVATAARLDELNRLEGYLPSAFLSKRKGILKKQLAELTTTPKKEDVIDIHIEISEEGRRVEKKEKSYAFNLKNLLSGEFGKIEEDDEDDVLSVVKKLLPARKSSPIFGKVVTEL